MTPTTITLPWSAVAQDNHRLTPARGRLVTAGKYRRAKQAAEILATAQWRGPLHLAPVVLFARVLFPDARRRDAGNYRKLITDALTGICYADDSLVWRETWERAGIDRANPRIEITVTPLD